MSSISDTELKPAFFAALGVFSNENDTASFKASASFSEIRFSFVTVFSKESVIFLSWICDRQDELEEEFDDLLSEEIDTASVLMDMMERYKL